MATVTQRGGKYRVQIRLRGTSRSATFERHADAKAWESRIESQILDGIQGNDSINLYFGDIVKRYLETVTPSKRGSRSESYRIGRVLKTDIVNVRLDDLRPQHFGQNQTCYP